MILINDSITPESLKFSNCSQRSISRTIWRQHILRAGFDWLWQCQHSWKLWTWCFFILYYPLFFQHLPLDFIHTAKHSNLIFWCYRTHLTTPTIISCSHFMFKNYKLFLPLYYCEVGAIKVLVLIFIINASFL